MMSSRVIFTISVILSVIHQLPDKEVESSDTSGDNENDNRKSHDFNVIG
jgi:hypothetical protein